MTGHYQTFSSMMNSILYVSMDLFYEVEKEHSIENPVTLDRWFVAFRKKDDSVTIGPHGIDWPKDFWDYRKKDVDFFICSYDRFVSEDPFHGRGEIMMTEVRLMTDEERERYAV